MRLRPAASLVLACILPFAAGCGHSAPHSAPPPDGSIQGSITFSGPLPQSGTAQSPQASPGTPPCRQGPFSRREDRMLSRSQPPVFLWISGGLQNRAFTAPHQQAVLTQIHCGFQPQILGVLPNQPIDFTNSDPFSVHFHVAPTLAGNPALNLTLPPRKPGQVHSFPHPELLIPVTSPQRPSMHAWINVIPNPFFTLSGPQGHFSLRQLPPGTYSLSAISPGFPTQTLSATIKPNAVTRLTLTFGKSTPPSQARPRK